MSGKNRVAQQKKREGKRKVTRVDKTDDTAQRKKEALKPLNKKQSQYINAIKSESVVICTGVWGSSKTYIPSILACDMLEAKEVDKVVIARPTEGKGKSVGFFKGDKNEKLSGWCAPITETMKKRLGEGVFQAFLDNGKIELLALEQVKGRSFENTFTLIDEGEDLEPEVARSLVGRQGLNSKTIITGDVNQKDIKSNSGLELLLKVAEIGDLELTHIDFDDWKYCVRSPEAKAWGMAFEKYDKLKEGK
jgi:phosphate starvation-inducible protein PhoH and related proteins